MLSSLFPPTKLCWLVVVDIVFEGCCCCCCGMDELRVLMLAPPPLPDDTEERESEESLRRTDVFEVDSESEVG